MPDNKEVEFLKTYLAESQAKYQTVTELGLQDFARPSEDTTGPDNYEDAEDAERAARAKAKRVKSEEDANHAARLADDNGFDGNLFRDLFSSREWNGFELGLLIRRLEKQIETIPRITAQIERPADRSIIPKGAKLLTVEQLARKLNMGVSVARDKNDKGLIPAPIRIGDAGTLYWHDTEIEHWIENHCPNRQRWDSLKQKEGV